MLGSRFYLEVEMNPTKKEMHITEDAMLREQLIQDWKDHTKKPKTVRERLVDRLNMPMGDEALIEVGALASHLYGEHMGEWLAGLQYLQQLGSEHADASAAAKHRLNRQEAILRKAVDIGQSLDAFEAADRFYVTTLAVPAITLQKSAEEGWVVFREAEALLAAVDSADTRRLFAVMTANLVCDLLERYELSATAKDFLVVLAEKSQGLWFQDGSDADREKAAFRLTQSYQACRKPEGYGSGRYTRYLWVEP